MQEAGKETQDGRMGEEKKRKKKEAVSCSGKRKESVVSTGRWR